MKQRRCALYRLFDVADVLLYIGITINLEARWKSHAATKTWWGDVARKEIEWHGSEELADTAETAAIVAERPLHNVAKSPWAPKPRELNANESLVGKARYRFTEIIDSVQRDRIAFFLVDQTKERRPVAAVVPVEFADAVEAVGGADAALAILRAA